MKCRKHRDVIKTGVSSLLRDKTREKPAYCPSGGRHRGGVSSAQALVRNVGTSTSMFKGAPQAEEPQGAEYRCEVEGRTGP